MYFHQTMILIIFTFLQKTILHFRRWKLSVWNTEKLLLAVDKLLEYMCTLFQNPENNSYQTIMQD